MAIPPSPAVHVELPDEAPAAADGVAAVAGAALGPVTVTGGAPCGSIVEGRLVEATVGGGGMVAG